MTLKLSEIEERFATYDGVGPTDMGSVGDFADLVAWAKRARPWLEVLKDHIDEGFVEIPTGQAKELEQLLGEVEE